jgi:hypothetical protein
MPARRLALLALSLITLIPVACFRNLKAEIAKHKPLAKDNLPAPTPPVPLYNSDEKARLNGVQPPKIELAPGTVPPLPGMPGSVSQPIPMSVPDTPTGQVRERSADDLAMTDEDPQRKGILERLRERRMEREKKGLPELPPAVDPKKESPKEEPKPQPVTPDAKADSLKAVRVLVDAAAAKFKDSPDFESKLVKRETVSGKKQPTEEIRFLFRKDPFSVRLTVTGENGRGREVLYVKGQNAGKLVIVTGEGDNRLIGAGKKIELDPDSPLATNRSRGRIEDSGLGRPIRVLTKFVEEAEQGKRSADTIRALGPVQRKEYKHAVEGVEVTLKTTDDPLLPKGGKRQYYFDIDPRSPSYHLPVLVITYEPNGDEVEYFCFSDFKLPANLTDADFSAEHLGRRR